MTWGEARMGGGGWWPRWGSVVHGGVLLATLGGLTVLWATLALSAALLTTPVETMQLFERKGAWGAADALSQGTAVLVGTLLPRGVGER